MKKMLEIDAKGGVIRVSSRTVRQVLGAGEIETHRLPNGDKLKVNKESIDENSFTIGHSVPFRGSGVVITTASVNISNMTLFLNAITHMVTFEASANKASLLATSLDEQMDFWPM